MQNTENFEDMLNDSFKPQKSMELGDRVKAIVSGSDKENVYLDLGPRIQGIANKNEFMTDGKLSVNINDEITVYITGKARGFIKCSRRLGGGDQETRSQKDDTYTAALTEAYENGVPVEGKVTKIVKGGMEVTIMGKRTFCPISQVDLNYCDNADPFLNNSYTFLITEVKEDGDDFIVSRKRFLQQEKDKISDQLWQDLKENDLFEGTVTSLKKYGAFVDIGGIEGLLHVSEISHEKIDDPSEKLKVGDKLQVEVINLDREQKKIGLSLKSQIEDPSQKILNELAVGDEMEGTVVKLKPFGAFVNLFTGIDGLLHISKLGLKKRIDHPKEMLSINDKVNVRILEIDKESGRISLTMEEEKQDFNRDLKKIKKEQDELFKNKGTMADLFKDF